LSAWVLPLEDARLADTPRVGGKAARLGHLIREGYRVPPGVVLTTAAYEAFLAESNLTDLIQLELGRKDLGKVRWEELWDSALRIRSAFARAPLPTGLEAALAAALAGPLAGPLPLAVRSSAPAEDGAGRSFAGVHASVLERRGLAEVLQALRVVWASLWSDVALLYRRELGLDPLQSRMAVVIQSQVAGQVSGVAFGRDPRQPRAERVVIEAVPGACEGLVSGALDPDRYVLERVGGEVLQRRKGGDSASQLLSDEQIRDLWRLLAEVEASCGWAPDMEWTRDEAGFVVLQARPAGGARPEDERSKYLRYCPRPQALSALREEVEDGLIPELRAEGRRLAAELVESWSDAALASAGLERQRILERWRGVYDEAFIPLAHGVRALGLLYNDVLQPCDPHEFVELLRGESFLATQRDEVLARFAEALQATPGLRASFGEDDPREWEPVLEALREAGEAELGADLDALRDGSLDVVFEGVRLALRPDLVLGPLLRGQRPAAPRGGDRRAELEALLLEAAGRRVEEARHVLEVARVAWRLRDDDNILLGRIESQLLRVVREAEARLRDRGLLAGRAPRLNDAAEVCAALASGEELKLPGLEASALAPSRARPRQLVGQPASPGIATGPVCLVRSADDLGAFEPGAVLVCDAIQPQMTHVVPLASAVVERRGGMLIHGAILARELGIPCVNGVPGVTSSLRQGERITVDGDLGLVTVGTNALPPRGSQLSPA
jgi:phosphohistidine swiveling domain-containing protein